MEVGVSPIPRARISFGIFRPLQSGASGHLVLLRTKWIQTAHWVIFNFIIHVYTEMWCYRRVLRIPWTERKINAWVLDKIGAARNGTKAKVAFLWTCNSKEGTRKNDHHREGQRKEKERPSPNIMAQGHQELYRDDTARCCESSRG